MGWFISFVRNMSDGATVTVIAQNQVMMTSGAAVARQVGILEPTIRPQARFVDGGRTLDWATLVAEGAVRNLKVMPEQLGLQRSATHWQARLRGADGREHGLRTFRGAVRDVQPVV